MARARCGMASSGEPELRSCRPRACIEAAMAITSAGSTAAPMETRGLFATIDDEFVTNMTTVLVPLAASATGRREPVPRRQAATKFASFACYMWEGYNGAQDQS